MATVRAEPTRPRVRVELALGLAVFAYYLVVSHLGGAAREARAIRHAEAVYGLEQALWLDIEPGLNQGLRPHHALVTLANYEYATTYVLSALALLIWLLVRRARAVPVGPQLVPAAQRRRDQLLRAVADRAAAAGARPGLRGHRPARPDLGLLGLAGRRPCQPAGRDAVAALRLGGVGERGAGLDRPPLVAAVDQRRARRADLRGHRRDRQPLRARRGRRLRAGVGLRRGGRPAAAGDHTGAGGGRVLPARRDAGRAAGGRRRGAAVRTAVAGRAGGGAPGGADRAAALRPAADPPVRAAPLALAAGR